MVEYRGRNRSARHLATDYRDGERLLLIRTAIAGATSFDWSIFCALSHCQTD